jgi:hypothetical protein
MHVGKFFYPESRFFFGGQELPLEPQPHHRVVAHLLWDLPLLAEHLTPGPRLGFGWKLLPTGEGCFYDTAYNLEQATPTEQRGLTRRIRTDKESLRIATLLRFDRANPSEANTWEKKWRKWNQIFPDWAFPSWEAMRQAIRYQRDKACPPQT